MCVNWRETGGKVNMYGMEEKENADYLVNHPKEWTVNREVNKRVYVGRVK